MKDIKLLEEELAQLKTDNIELTKRFNALCHYLNVEVFITNEGHIEGHIYVIKGLECYKKAEKLKPNEI